MREIHCQGGALEYGTEDRIAELSQFILLIMHSLGAAQRAEEEKHLYGSSTPEPQQEFRRSCACQGEKAAFPNSFYPLSAGITHGRAAAPELPPETLRLCPPSGLPHRAAPLPWAPAPQSRAPHTPCPSSQAGQDGIISLLCTAGPGASPAPAQADLELVWSVSQPCPHVLPLGMALDGATRGTSGHSQQFSSPCNTCPGPACCFLPKQESRGKAWLQSPCHGPGLMPPSSPSEPQPSSPGFIS